jgi:hypothetical protein
VRGKRVTAWTLCATTGFFNDLLGRAQDLDLHRLPTEGAPEFINRPLYYYCLYEGIAFTRSRPYRKNDSAHVEQKNGAIVRALVGYDRYASRGAYAQLARVYRLLRLHTNFFQPVQRLLAKSRHGDDNDSPKLLLVHPAVAVERLADERGLHRDNLRKHRIVSNSRRPRCLGCTSG